MTIAFLAVARPETASARMPTNDEYALLVFANEARANPAADGGTEPVVPPLLWSDDLGEAAQAHSDDMAANGCFSHSSCNGQSWSTRVTSFYPDWEWIGENIGSGDDDPEALHHGWMASWAHRANILSGAYNEFGGATAIGQDGFGPFPVATEDFGRRSLFGLQLMPALPAGAVLPRVGGSESREFLVNYYHYNGSTPVVRALIGSSCVNMTRRSGSAAYGTYSVERSVSGSGCVPVAFEATRSDGQTARFPTTGSILVGVGAAGENCAQRSTQNPSASCGGGTPVPTPTPTPSSPTPTPGQVDTGLSEAQVMLRDRGNSASSQARINGTVAAGDTFDPSAASLRLDLTLPGGARWSEVLPVLCDDEPCLRPNRNRTAFRARYTKKGPWLSVVQTEGGKWRVRYSTNTTSLPQLVDGAVTLEIGADGATWTTQLDGYGRPSGYMAR